MMLKQSEVQAQSNAAWKAWKDKWIANCTVTKTLDRIPMKDFVGKGKGKLLVQCAFGHSLALNTETIKDHRDKLDVMCCDKAFGYLMENGITPDYCVIADASVEPKWIKGQDTFKTVLVSNVAANPEWTVGWKGPRVFYTNWDNIGTAFILAKAAGVYDVIAASSNVSNAQVVFASQVLGHEAQLLVGYDYSWEDGGRYYAGEDSEKRHYMHHLDIVSPFGYLAMTSQNLVFSCRWMLQYAMKFNQVEMVNCSQRGIMEMPKMMPLGKAINLYHPMLDN